MKKFLVFLPLFGIISATYQPTHKDIEFLQATISSVIVDPFSTIDFAHEGINAPVRNIQTHKPTGDNALTRLFFWLAHPEEQLLMPIELLLAHNIDINYQCKPYGETALYLACRKMPPSPKIIELLMTARPNTTLATSFGETPLDVASKQMARHPQYEETYEKIIQLLQSTPQ